MIEYNDQQPELTTGTGTGSTKITADDVDELFLERLQAFLDKSLVDLRAFSLRENRPFDQVT